MDGPAFRAVRELEAGSRAHLNVRAAALTLITFNLGLRPANAPAKFKFFSDFCSFRDSQNHATSL